MVTRKLIETVLERLIDLPFSPTRTLRHVHTNLGADFYQLELIMSKVEPDLDPTQRDAKTWQAMKAALAFRSMDVHHKMAISNKLNLSNTDVPDYAKIRQQTARILVNNEGATLKNDLALHKKPQPQKQTARMAAVHDDPDEEPSVSSGNSGTCLLCGSQKHPADKCKSLLKLPVADRAKYVMQQRVCMGCLSKPHIKEEVCGCKALEKLCTVGNCKRKHHTLLHTDAKTTRNSEQQKKGKDAVVAAAQTIDEFEDDKVALIPTALVNIIGGDGESYPARVFLDSGASHTITTEEFANRLHLEYQKVRIKLKDYAGAGSLIITKAVNVAMKPWFSSLFAMRMKVLVTKELESNYPSTQVEVNLPKSFDHALLADPNFDRPNKIDMRQLLFHDIQPIKDCPQLVNTPLGYIVWGNEVAATARIATLQAYVSLRRRERG